MQIGSYSLSTPVVVAPMAGVSDRPFRQLALNMGAGMAVSEMMSANPDTWDTDKSLKRMYVAGEPGIRSVQIVGAEPDWMADAARRAIDEGAQIVDINMGCPAKKINRRLAGSALLQDPELVRAILNAVVSAVPVPVTLKIRTGWDTAHRNGVEIARIAESCGIQALTVHGRTRACMFQGKAEYDTIRAIKQQITIPVIANGDIDSPQKAQAVLDYTGADAVMIGRAAQGNPWLFQQVRHFLQYGTALLPPSPAEVEMVVLEHVAALHQFYGEYKGVRFARKHVAWYLERYESAALFRRGFNTLTTAEAQLDALKLYFSNVFA